jgi:hypothetical protein
MSDKNGHSDEPAPTADSTYDLAPVEAVEGAGPPASDERRSVSEDRRCQSCGAPMPEDESIMVCPSCGYDIVTNRIIDPTTTGSIDSRTDPSTDVGVDPEPSPLGPPLVVATSWRSFLIAAGILLATVAFAMIAGWSSFFPREDGNFLDAEGKALLDAPPVLARFSAVLRLLVGSTVLVICGGAAARATAWFESRTLGDPSAVLARLALAVAVAAWARLIPIESHVLQNLVHGGLGIAAIAVVSMMVLGDRGRLLGLFLVCWGLAFLLVVPVARLIAWSIPIF